MRTDCIRELMASACILKPGAGVKLPAEWVSMEERKAPQAESWGPRGTRRQQQVK